MAGWPFTTSSAPNLDTGLTTVPTVDTVIATDNPIYLLGATFSNSSAASINVRVHNGAGVDLVPTMEIPPGMVITLAFAFEPINGLGWVASATSLVGHLWGYK